MVEILAGHMAGQLLNEIEHRSKIDDDQYEREFDDAKREMDAHFEKELAALSTAIDAGDPAE